MEPDTRILLFGRFEMAFQGEPVDLTAGKVQELLGYLILNQGRAHPRETLAELLWSESESLNARKYLRQALWQLQAGLPPSGRGRARNLIRQEPGWIELTLDRTVWVDTIQFERAFNSVRGRDALTTADLQRVVDAVQLYRGDLLEGHCQDWCIYERDRFREMYLTLLDKVIDDCDTRGQYETGVAYATLALRCDPARERTHRSLMSLHHHSDNRTGALRQYDRCAAVLRDELGIAPGRDTEELRLLICAGAEVRSRRGAALRRPALVLSAHQDSSQPTGSQVPRSRKAPSYR